jgi:hypothetical protein
MGKWMGAEFRGRNPVYLPVRNQGFPGDLPMDSWILPFASSVDSFPFRTSPGQSGCMKSFHTKGAKDAKNSVSRPLSRSIMLFCGRFTEELPRRNTKGHKRKAEFRPPSFALYRVLLRPFQPFPLCVLGVLGVRFRFSLILPVQHF